MKYIYEIILGISIVLFGIVLYSWFQLNSMAREEIKSTAISTVTASCLVFGSEYLKKRNREAENQFEEG